MIIPEHYLYMERDEDQRSYLKGIIFQKYSANDYYLHNSYKNNKSGRGFRTTIVFQ